MVKDHHGKSERRHFKFKALSVKSASVSTAGSAGITTADILKAADWSNQPVFQNIYYKPLKDTSFEKAVLSKPVISYKVTLIRRLSILKYNYRMAQTMQWSPAFLDYMKYVKSNISMSHPTTSQIQIYINFMT